MMYDSSPWTLRMMTPGARSIFCARAVTSMPVSFGIAMSTIIRSGCSSSQSRTASSPSAASATTEISAASSNPRSPRLTMLWSSASSTRKWRLRQWRRQRQPHGNRRAPHSVRRDHHGALQFLDALLDANQAQAPSATRRIQAHAIVADRQLELALIDVHVDRYV